MKIYISGPMTNLPEYNYPAFEAAEIILKDMGHEPVSPHRVQPPDGEQWTWDQYMVEDIKLLAECEAIAMLPGWTTSKGAQVELKHARDLRLQLFQLRNDELVEFTNLGELE